MREKLGEILLRQGHLNNHQLNDALARQKDTKKKIGESLVSLGHCSEEKVYAALAYVRANGLDRIIWDSAAGSKPARLGIITTGKSYGDTMQALSDLGIDENTAREIGIRLYKVAMSWPLEPQGARKFAQGLEEILVVEEKRQMVEYQLKEQLYNWRPDVRPNVLGKFDDSLDGGAGGEWGRPNPSAN